MQIVQIKKNKNHRKQACEAAAEKITYKDMSKIFLENLLNYFQINSIANKIIQSLKTAETSKKEN